MNLRKLLFKIDALLYSWQKKKNYLEKAKYLNTYRDLPHATIFKFGRQKIKLAIKWQDLSTHIYGCEKRLTGGIVSDKFKTSFAVASENNGLLVYNCAQLPARLESKEDIEKSVAFVLAHEARHLLGNDQGYGLLEELIIPNLTWGKYLFFGLPILKAFNLILLDWISICLLMGYPAILGAYYLLIPCEMEAREYSREFWEEYLQFVTVEIIG